MYANAAYLDNNHFDNADPSNPLTVKSCGNFRILRRKAFTTYRPRGRRDFQLLYIASGQTHFFFDEKEILLSAGNMILFRPGQVQNYIYYAKDKPEVFWIHFSGTDADKLLRQFGLGDRNIFFTGLSPEFNRLFLGIIAELQSAAPNYREACALMLQNIMILAGRLASGDKNTSDFSNEIKKSIHYFNTNYKEDISIDNYAQKCHISLSWFIRSFKKYTGVTPMQYILSVRIANAQSLLESSEYTVSEIASIVGYDNALYFSRLFKKQTGMSPMEYRKKHID